MSYQAIERHGEILNTYSKVNKVNLKRLPMAWFPLTAFWGRRNCAETDKIPGCQEPQGARGWIGRAQRTFGPVNLFCVMLERQLHVVLHLSKPIKCSSLRVRLHVNDGLWATVRRPCSFIGCDKCTAPVQRVDRGGICACLVAGGPWEPFTFCSVWLWT